MPKNKNICKDLSFADCELAILRMAVDEAEGPFIERKLDAKSAFVTNVACQPKCDHILAPAMHMV